MGMGLGLQFVGGEKGRVQKRAGSTGVDERHDRDGEKTGKKNMNGKGKVTGGGKGEGMGQGEDATQPGPYWLGLEFPDLVSAGGVAGGCAGAGSWCQAPG